MVVELRSRANFDEMLSLSRDHLAVVDFFATWCPPCKRIAPLFQQLSEELPDVKFFKLDVDAVSDVARSEAIRAMPTFKFYRNGRCEETIQGGNPSELRSAIERLRPPPPLLESVLDLAGAEGEMERREAAIILVKIATNILREPLNPKFRRLKVSNKIVTEKLLIVAGAMQCLIAMGFRDTDDAFVLDPEKALDDVRLVKSQIEKIVLSEKGCAAGDPAGKGFECSTANSTPAPATAAAAPAPATVAASAPASAVVSAQASAAAAPAPSACADSAPALDVEEMEKFRATISRTLDMMMVYEQPHLQEKARTAMDWKSLSTRVNIADTDALVSWLLNWFKNDFFTWTNAPPCLSCDVTPEPIGNGQPSLAETEGWASRVELYRCPQHGLVRFPRYNHPGRLLETRTGRCGEWANCFMLILRAAGVRSRYVLDWTDHVWCEVFLHGRWVHCDPCEAALDKPLLYEAGWGKKLSYVLAFGRHDVQDVTWRYTQKQSEVLLRRTAVTEAWLVSTIIATRRHAQRSLAQTEREEMERETLTELVELLSSPREAGKEELQGRQSGSKEWRQQRGEMGTHQEIAAGTVIRPLPEEVAANKLELRYSCAFDVYERPLAQDPEKQKSKDWRSYAFSFLNISFKEERDWRMVYLARPEGCPSTDAGFIEWTFDFHDSGRRLSSVRIMCSGAEFHSGRVTFELKNDQHTVDVRGLYIDSEVFRGSRRVTLRATVDKGNGDMAWQHAQLFRQKKKDGNLFPLNVIFELEPDEDEEQ